MLFIARVVYYTTIIEYDHIHKVYETLVCVAMMTMFTLVHTN